MVVVERAALSSAPKVSLTAKRRDLGTLGGRSSEAVAVDGSIVVGHSETATGETHAFVYDLAAAQPQMVDLGTLGGTESRAVAVSGSIVVGTARTASRDEHAFAYDLAAAEPRMIDLGTLGGSNSRARDVDGSFVVGWAETSAGDDRAFVYDLDTAEPAMVDLGTLGGDRSYASAVDGTVIVGGAATELNDAYGYGSQIVRAFAYDLAADEPKMIMLGTVAKKRDDEYHSAADDVGGSVVAGTQRDAYGYDHTSPFYYDLAADAPRAVGMGGGDVKFGDSAARAVDGNLIVGWVGKAALSSRAFVYDVSDRAPAMREFDTLRGAHSSAVGVSGEIAVGDWYWMGTGRYEAFAHDLGAAEARTLGLGPGSQSRAIDGDVVVGVASYGGATRATAWTLLETRRPMLAFRRAGLFLGEGAGRVKFRVDRYGRTDRAVTVRYRTKGDTAKAGKDFVATSGKLRFKPGVTTRIFTVKIRDDRRPERTESLWLKLSRPSKRAQLGTPSWSRLTIRDNDR